METFSALLAFCAGNSPVTGEFPAQRPVTRGFDVFFDLRLNKRLSRPKQAWGSWSETPSSSLWRHCNVWHKNIEECRTLTKLPFIGTRHAPCCFFAQDEYLTSIWTGTALSERGNRRCKPSWWPLINIGGLFLSQVSAINGTIILVPYLEVKSQASHWCFILFKVWTMTLVLYFPIKCLPLMEPLYWCFYLKLKSLLLMDHFTGALY